MNPPESFKSQLNKLDALSRQISSITDSISSDLQRINRAIGILAKRIGEEAWIQVESDDARDAGFYGLRIGIAKDSQGWGLVALGRKLEAMPDDPLSHQEPLASCSLKIRLTAARYIPNLVCDYIGRSEPRWTMLQSSAQEIRHLAELMESVVKLEDAAARK